MNILTQIKDMNLSKVFIEGNIGIEKEGLRVAEETSLSKKNHPAIFSARRYITTDFGEAQVELITPPLSPYYKAYDFLEALSYILLSNLPAEEYIWPFSVPCHLPAASEIKISKTADEKVAKYRQYTSEKYGKKRQLISGIHINYSFSDDFIHEFFEKQTTFLNTQDLIDELYLILTSNFLRYQWLLIYLFGATPVAEDNFFECPFFEGKELPTKAMRSLRNSEYGFNNKPRVVVRYDTVENYVRDLNQAVKSGKLAKEREYYGDIRLRGSSDQANELLNTGIQYIEIRSFDINPFYTSGITKEILQFIHLFLLTMLCLPNKATAEETAKGDKLTKQVASEFPHSKTALYTEGIWLLRNMEHVIEVLKLDPSYQRLVDNAMDALNHPKKTTAGRITSLIQNEIPLLNLGELLGFHHKNQIFNMENLPGFKHLTKKTQEEYIQNILIGKEISESYFKDIEDLQKDI